MKRFWLLIYSLMILLICDSLFAKGLSATLASMPQKLIGMKIFLSNNQLYHEEIDDDGVWSAFVLKPDEKNGYLRIQDCPPPGGCEIYTYFALFLDDQKNSYIAKVTIVEGPVGPEKTSIEIFSEEKGNWKNCTRSVLPEIDVNAFFNKKLSVDEKQELFFGQYACLYLHYRLPRYGTTIEVRPYIRYNAENPKLVNQNVKWEKLLLVWNKKKGKFEISTFVPRTDQFILNGLKLE